VATKTAPVGPLVPALLSVSPPTVTAGNTVKVDGMAWPSISSVQASSVALTLVGPGGSVNLGTVAVAAGAFSTTVTIPANTAPGSYKIHGATTAPPVAQADAEIQVVAAGPQGTMTITFAGIADTNINVDTSEYVLSGTNFSPGPIQVFIDAPTGQVLVASGTVGANGTFQAPFRIGSDQIGGQLGPHKLTAVQNGASRGELNITVVPRDRSF
jgi:hypothetical protein